MITEVREPRLLVTSDTHVGNLFCDARRGLVRFLEYACANQYNVCVNGDGIDVQYTSLRRFTMETSALMRDLARITSQITVYYTIGNHDFILEHYLGAWGGLKLVPFLNVTSGNTRIRIEHGHLYDAFLMKHPQAKRRLARLLTHLCRLYPPGYHWHAKFQMVRYRYIRRLLGRDPHLLASPATMDDSPTFIEAAEELAQRGFDYVMFGHTHHPGIVALNGDGAAYVNTGSWFGRPHFAVIEDGRVELKAWPP